MQAVRHNQCSALPLCMNPPPDRPFVLAGQHYQFTQRQGIFPAYAQQVKNM